MGVVWKAHDTRSTARLPIKVLPESFASDPERLARFEREAKILASLSHPNIAAVHGLHEAGGTRFLAMELVWGGTFTDAIARGIPPERVVELAVEIADGLGAAHRQGVVYRDLKPDNIMIDIDGLPRILDFGLAKLGSGTGSLDAPTMSRTVTTTQEGSLLGTVAYMSP